MTTHATGTREQWLEARLRLLTAEKELTRRVDAIWGMYQWLDRAPLGRNEKGMWWRRHDEYGAR
jgi:predicted dithiol-disulfide oxidoreductase (DUF899 family)